MHKELEKVLLNDNSTMFGYKNDYIINKIKEKKGYYEIEVLKKFGKYIPQDSVIYDIGANIGNHTVYFHKYMNPKKIYSFEPIKEIYDVLIKNIENNNIKDVVTFNKAVGNIEGKVRMEIDNNNLGASKIVEEDIGDIQVVSIDNTNLEGPNFIKIDVEEYELKVLLGMKNTLIKYKPIIWIEIFPHNFEKINEYLDNIGYEIVERIENNCIYKAADSEEQRKLINKRFKINIINYYDNSIADIRKRYKNLAKDLGVKKEAFKLANEKYRDVNTKYSKLKDKIQEKEKEIQILKDRLYDEMGKCTNSDSELNMNKKHLEKLEIKYENIIKQNDFLNDNNIIKEDEIRDLNKSLLTLQDELKKLNIINDEKENIIKKEKHERAQLETLNKLLEEEKQSINIKKSEEIELLSKKAIKYINYLEETLKEKNDLNEKRKYLLERNETLYKNNQKLVKELENLKAKYKALRGSKLGKITVAFWKLKRRWL